MTRGRVVPGGASTAIAALLAVLLAGSCAVAPPPQPPPGTTGAPADFPSQEYAPRAADGGVVYSVVPAESVVTIRVYRGGRAAKLGHNHVVVSRAVNGLVLLADEPAKSRFDLYVAVHELIVDDPQDREQAGDDFATKLSERAVSGTRSNMLGEQVLDVARHPFVRVGGRLLGGSQQPQIVRATFRIRGATQHLDIPVQIRKTRTGLVANGSLVLRQTDFGIHPFSVLGGALVVRDELELGFSITAQARE